MKKKSPRGIPDFSSKGPKSRLLVDKNAEKPARQPHAAPNPKPQATAVKSGGRRGG
jgi:hypothetical protein